MDLTEEEAALYERMKVDLNSVGYGDRLRVMGRLTRQQYLDLTMPKQFMTSEEKALYQRARDDPASITPGQKNQIFERMDPEEEDRLCRERTGLAFTELQAKALEDAGSLTNVEATILAFGGDCDPDAPMSRHRAFWVESLPAEEQELAKEVRNLLDYEYESTVKQRARSRLLDLYAQYTPKQKAERRARARQILSPSQLAKWVQDILDAKPPRCGFVIFRTVYGDGSDEKWKLFGSHERLARNIHLKHHWKRATNLKSKFHSVYVSDPSLEGIDMEALRARFRTMRDSGEIPEGIATTCFLVADETVLNNDIIEGKVNFAQKSAEDPDPWSDTLMIRAVKADYDVSDGRGEIVLPIPKTFEWLYFYTTFTTDTPWETLYETVQEGPAEILEPHAPLPLWRDKREEVLRTNNHEL